MNSEIPDPAKSVAENLHSPIDEFVHVQQAGMDVGLPEKPRATDQEIAGVWVVFLALVLPNLFTRLPTELTLLVRYSYVENVTGIVYAIGYIALTWFLIWRTRVSWVDVGLVRRIRYTDVLAAAALIVFAHVLSRFAYRLLHSDSYVDSWRNYHFRPVGVLSWALTIGRITVAAFAEEFLFRGYLFTRLERMLSSKLWAVLMASVAFGVVHTYQGVIGVLGATFFGVLSTIAFASTRRLWLTTLAHVGYNLSVFILADEPEIDPERDAHLSTATPVLEW